MTATSLPRLACPARRRGLIVLLATTFRMWAGFFMVVPLLSVYYVDKLGWAAASIGASLALRQLLQQGLSPVSGVLRGSTLLGLKEGHLPGAREIGEAKRLMRWLIGPHLGGKPLKSRELFKYPKPIE